MFYDLVGTDEKYQGVDRSLDLIHYKRKDNNRFEIFLTNWLGAIELTDILPQNANNFDRLCDLCKIINHISACNIIVYDDKPIDNAYGREVNFLGIDIVADRECPLKYDHREDSKKILNNNGLCPDIEAAHELSYKWKGEYKHFEFLYVYTVLLNDGENERKQEGSND